MKKPYTILLAFILLLATACSREDISPTNPEAQLAAGPAIQLVPGVGGVVGGRATGLCIPTGHGGARVGVLDPVIGKGPAVHAIYLGLRTRLGHRRPRIQLRELERGLGSVVEDGRCGLSLQGPALLDHALVDAFLQGLQLHDLRAVVGGFLEGAKLGGFFAGVAKVPIASVVMVTEMTGGYSLLAPLMLVSVVSMMLSTRWTMYQAQVPSQIDSPAHAGDFVVDVLEKLRVGDLLDAARKPELISANTTLRHALDIVSKANGYYFPVVDKEERMVGIFSLSDVRRIFQETGVADLVIVRDFMVERVSTVRLHDNLDAALRGMTEFHVNTLPVVDDDDERVVLTLLDRQELGKAYAAKLRELRGSDEG